MWFIINLIYVSSLLLTFVRTHIYTASVTTTADTTVSDSTINEVPASELAVPTSDTTGPLSTEELKKAERRRRARLLLGSQKITATTALEDTSISGNPTVEDADIIDIAPVLSLRESESGCVRDSEAPPSSSSSPDSNSRHHNNNRRRERSPSLDRNGGEGGDRVARRRRYSSREISRSPVRTECDDRRHRERSRRSRSRDRSRRSRGRSKSSDRHKRRSRERQNRSRSRSNERGHNYDLKRMKEDGVSEYKASRPSLKPPPDEEGKEPLYATFLGKA